MSPPTLLHLVIPVYNEGDNFPSLRAALDASLHTPFEALVVYDFDQDNTIPAVEQAAREGDTRFRLVKNSAGGGVVGALRTGFAAVPSGPLLVVMGDLSDDLGQVDTMLRLYREGYQVVVPSRYMPGGKVLGGPLLKKSLSRWAGRSLHHLRGLPTSDATNSFKLYDAEMLHSFTLESRGGWEVSLEITVKAFLAGYRITELPAVWRDRTAGESRFRLWRWLPLYLKWYFYAFRPRARAERAPAGQ